MEVDWGCEVDWGDLFRFVAWWRSWWVLLLPFSVASLHLLGEEPISCSLLCSTFWAVMEVEATYSWLRGERSPIRAFSFALILLHSALAWWRIDVLFFSSLCSTFWAFVVRMESLLIEASYSSWGSMLRGEPGSLAFSCQFCHLFDEEPNFIQFLSLFVFICFNRVLAQMEAG